MPLLKRKKRGDYLVVSTRELTASDLAPIPKMETDPNDPMGLMGPRWPTKKVEMKDIVKQQLTKSVITQAKQLRWDKQLFTKWRTSFVEWWTAYKIRKGWAPAPVVKKENTSAINDSCPCSCPMGARYGEKDTHTIMEFNGYKYRFCGTCKETLGWENDYYFCWSNAPRELAVNVAAAIREGEI